MQSVGFAMPHQLTSLAMPLKLGLTDWAAPKSTGKADSSSFQVKFFIFLNSCMGGSCQDPPTGLSSGWQFRGCYNYISP